MKGALATRTRTFALLLALAPTLSACRSTDRPAAEPAWGAGSGFALRDCVSLDAKNNAGAWRLVVTAPTGGWTVELVEERFARNGPAAIIRAQAPAGPATQVLTSLTLDTKLDASRPLTVTVRCTNTRSEITTHTTSFQPR